MSISAETWRAPFGLAGYRWPATRPRAIVLLQHGYAEHARRYVDHACRLVPTLVAAGYEVCAFDMAGHGRSGGRRGDTDIAAMVAAHVAARTKIAQRGLPLFLIGHSLGGLVTAASVAQAPAGPAGVILSAPSLPFEVPWAARAAVGVAARVAPMLGVAAIGDPAGLSRIEAEVAAYLADPLVFQRRLPARIAASALATAGAMWPALPAWQVPTLAIHGTADPATDPDGSARLIAGISATDKALVLVPDGRHELLNDLPRRDVLARIIEWLDRRAPA